MPYTFTALGADVDAGTTLTYSVTGNPAWLSINTATGVLSGTPGYDDAKIYNNIVVTVSDGTATTSLAAFTLEVTNTNRAPTITGAPNTTVAENAAYTFTPTGADADAGTTLTYSVAGDLPSGVTFDTSNGALTGKPTFDSAGTYSNIVIAVSDGEDSSSLAAFTLEVTNTNQAPTITGTPNTTVAENAAYTFTPIGADADSGTTLTYSIVGKPAWANFDPTDGKLSGTPGYDDAGTSGSITISVSDGEDTVALAAFSIDVTDTNRAPDADEQSINVVENIVETITLTGADADGDGISYSIVSDPQNGSLEGTPPNLVYTPVADFVGFDNFTFKINDGSVDSSTTTINIFVLMDVDNDGLADVDDPNNSNPDTDGDGIPDGADVDVDGDGENDNGTDTDGDGINDESDVDNTGGTDTDGDGIDDDHDTVDDSTDSDGDGLPDDIDPDNGNPDTDGDGIPDGADVDVDGDGVNDNGTDTDGDGINDLAEGQGDTDGDGVPNYLDTDSDGDGIPDADEGAGDADGDGIPDYADTDSDNDGIPDVDEGTADADDDGIPDYLDTDSDNDGIPDTDEGAADTDEDGIPDYLDTDSDNDGIPDADEGGADADDDGIPDYLDTDSDNDGVEDTDEGTGDVDGDGTPDYLDTSLDEDGDGILDIIEGTVDSDMDGTPDFMDTDSDNDGIPDILEAPLSVALTDVDSDKDGIDDAIDVDITDGSDSNGNGIDDAFEPRDTDGDGVPDYKDVDSDGDTLPDRIEAAMVMLVDFDGDGDGIDDFLDVDQTGGADLNGDGVDDQFAPRDTDGNGVPDHLSVDSDSDGIPDRIEAGTTGVDNDGDGIDDAFDVHTMLGPDANGDGIDDVVTALDSDGDGAPDYVDLDSDNDSIGDALEAGLPDLNRDGLADDDTTTDNPWDTDADGIADYLDVDSDGDGINDIDGNGYGLFDADGDGRIDEVADVDSDGVPDIIDNEVGRFGGSLDTDLDGVPNSLDLDDDNDGIPDAVENAKLPAMSGQDSDGDGIDDAIDASITGGKDVNGDGIDDALDGDTDGDGVPDSVDLDSDNDGIPDLLEYGAAFVTDADHNGRVDNFMDADGDGLHDAIDATLAALNSDGDDAPDFQDLDSDGDGLTDLVESGSSKALDANSDGRIDVFVDSDRDGIADVVDGELADGKAGPVPTVPDTDGDGQPDYRDADSDNDGFTDDLENGDFDKDGVPDNQQDSGELETAVTGGGSTGLLFLGLLLGVLVWRRFTATHAGAMRHLAVFALALVLLPAAHSADAQERQSCASRTDGQYQPCWFIGAGVGASHLDPEGQVNGWSTDDNGSTGYELHIGQHFAPHWFWELRYTDMGEAGLGNINPALDQFISDASVAYDLPSLMAGYVLWDKPYGFNLYAKAGVSAISTSANDSRIGLKRQTSTQLALGAGVQYRFKDSPWFVRLEFDSYDRDANIVGLSLTRYFGGGNGDSRRHSNARRVDNVVPKPVVAPAVTEATEQTPETPEPVVVDTDNDGVQDDQDNCPATEAGVAVDDTGCALFDRVLEGVNFTSNEAALTSQAEAILNDVADSLARFPAVIVEVQAHTDSQGNSQYNMDLSQRRAAAVIQYLSSQGVDSSRLHAKGYGESQPIASNEASSGRASNRRVAFRVLK